jgi:protein involved in polysaccharide export with SLBB domain
VSLGKLRAIKVYVMGDALTAGGYTLSSVSTIFTALYAAGGPSVRGSLREISLTRGSEEYVRLDGYDYLLRGDPSNDVRLEDGDIIFIPPIGPKVAVKGRVKREAIYELKSGETLEDIIAATGGVTASAELEKAQIARILPPEERGENPWVRCFIDVDLKQILDEDEVTLPVVDGDVVTVFAVPQDSRDFVVVEGAVWKSGRQQWHPGLTLHHAILDAGGLRETALMSRVNVIRTHPDETTEQISVNLEEVMNDNPQENILLEQRDRVQILSIHDVYPKDYIYIYGQVNTPGRYLLHENMTVIDLIVRAGGLTVDAWTDWAELVRINLSSDRSITEFTTQRVPIDTTYAPAGMGSALLQDLDQVFIRSKPLWEVQRNVELRGEVMFPGTYSLQRDDETVVELIRRAGSLSPYAFADGARFFRMKEGAGRINIDLSVALDNPNSLDNLVMMPGDSLYVPPLMNYITIRGAVGYPTSVLYVRGKGLRYYITQAGGYTEDADRKRTQVFSPNGDVWQSRGLFSSRPRIEPGSNIQVPFRTAERGDTWQSIRDVAGLLSNLTMVLLLIWQIGRG